jgi:hypothetical protein
MSCTTASTWARVAIVTVTLAICVSCAEPISRPQPIQDTIDSDANLG